MASEQLYRVRRDSREMRLPLSKMEEGDFITIAHPEIGTICLLEKPNGSLVGRTLPRGFGIRDLLGSRQSLSTKNIRPDEYGRVVVDCPSSRYGCLQSYTPGKNSRD